MVIILHIYGIERPPDMQIYSSLLSIFLFDPRIIIRLPLTTIRLQKMYKILLKNGNLI